jgi:CDP-diacylglycerol pyrophosphatase
MSRVLRCLMIGVLLLAAGSAEAGDRNRLWAIVRTCASAYRLIGVAFPCLKVVLPENNLNLGYAVLRPLKTDDLILSPTRETPGIEDPFLQSDLSPNYFAGAWRARSFLKGPDGEQPPRDDVSLIVNTEAVRSQDQLHIHIGCLHPDARRFFDEAARRMPLNAWTRIGPLFPNQIYFGERVREADFDRMNPVRVAAKGFVGAAENPGRLMVMVVGARVEDEDDLLIVAFFEGLARNRMTHAGAENLLDRSCTAPSPLGFETTTEK